MKTWQVFVICIILLLNVPLTTVYIYQQVKEKVSNQNQMDPSQKATKKNIKRLKQLTKHVENKEQDQLLIVNEDPYDEKKKVTIRIVNTNKLYIQTMPEEVTLAWDSIDGSSRPHYPEKTYVCQRIALEKGNHPHDYQLAHTGPPYRPYSHKLSLTECTGLKGYWEIPIYHDTELLELEN